MILSRKRLKKLQMKMLLWRNNQKQCYSSCRLLSVQNCKQGKDSRHGSRGSENWIDLEKFYKYMENAREALLYFCKKCSMIDVTNTDRLI